MLTPAQLSTLKAAIAANPTWNNQPQDSNGAYVIASDLNAAATPAFIVWKSRVGVTETGEAFNGTEWGNMVTGDHTRLQTVAQYLNEGYNAAKADIRAMFNDIWSGAGGVTTRANLLALWKRSATTGEKIYALGTGSDAVPATLVFEGQITSQEVRDAREQV